MHLEVKMHSSILIFLLALITREAHATELVRNHPANMEQLLDRAVRGLVLHHAELDATTLGKPGHLTIPSVRGIVRCCNHLTMPSSAKGSSSRSHPHHLPPPLAALNREFHGVQTNKVNAESPMWTEGISMSCCGQKSKPDVDRRDILLKGAACILCSTTGSVNAYEAAGDAAEGATEDEKCRFCSGQGVIPCDLCGGSGKWKAIGRKRANSEYIYTECPQCFGKGTLVCAPCFGTGFGATKVRGLLRKPEAQKMLEAMKFRKLAPGEAKELYELGLQQEQTTPA